MALVHSAGFKEVTEADVVVPLQSHRAELSI